MSAVGKALASLIEFRQVLTILQQKDNAAMLDEPIELLKSVADLVPWMRTDSAEGVEEYLGDDLEMMTAEGVQYAPTILIERDSDAGVVRRLEVGFAITEPEVDGEGNHVTHTMVMVPSTSTDEGEGTGNVFVYVDDDPVAHAAFGEFTEPEDEA